MEVNWVAPSDIDLRIDAEFYRSELLENERRIYSSTRCMSLDHLRESGRPITNGIRGPEEDDSDFRMLRLQDIDGLWIDSTKSLRITESQYRANKRAWCVRGDVLVAIGGYIGVVGKVVDSASQTMGQHSALLAFDRSKVDADYALAFFSSSPGAKLLQRYVSGGVQAGINLEDLREIRIPVPSPTIQRCIGNKVRKAERLREIAIRTQVMAQSAIDGMFGQIEWMSDMPFGWMSSKNLEDSRLDAWFNQPAYLRMADSLRARSALSPVSQFARLSTDPVDFGSFEADHFDYYEIADVDSGSGLIASTPVPVSSAPSRAKFAVGPGDILISTVRPNRKGIAIVPEHVVTAVCSSGFSILRAGDLETAYYLRACLMHDIATHQLMRWNTGATYPAIERSVPLSVLVPDPGVEQIQQLGSQLRACVGAFREVQTLVQSTRCDIEALVNGSLHETTLLEETYEIEGWLKQNPSRHDERR